VPLPSEKQYTSEKEVLRKLKFLKDPLKLAENVRLTLRDGEFDKAERLVRFASREGLYIVAWNHLINYQISHGKVNGAIKTYNEVSIPLFRISNKTNISK